MSDFTVKAQFEMDRESVSRGAGALQGALGRAAANIGNSFKSKILAAFGAGGVTFAIKSQLDKGFNTLKESRKLGLDPEEFQTLTRLSEQSGMAIDELAKRYLVAREKGTSFAQDVKAAMAGLKDEGLISQTSDVEKLSEAYQKLADTLGKLTPIVAKITATATTSPVSKGGLFSQMWGGLKIGAGSVMEWIGNQGAKLGGETGSATADFLRQKGLEWQLSGYESGAPDENDGKPDSSKPSKKKPYDDLLKKVIETQQTETLKKAMEADAGKSGSSTSVSSLKQIGGFMGSTPRMSPVETQLQLINRKLDDLVVSARKATL